MHVKQKELEREREGETKKEIIHEKYYPKN